MDVSNLSGRIVAVTGAASGIGRATALAFAERGADLALCDIDEDGLQETAKRASEMNRSAHLRRVDVASSEDVERWRNDVYTDLGRVDVLVNNAGIGIGGLCEDLPLDEWERVVGINLMGVVHGCHYFVPRLLEAARPAHIVNIASMAGYFAAPGTGPYNATKFAVIGLSESLRCEVRPRGIGVTAICPGVINTPIARSTRTHGAIDDEQSRDQMVRAFERRNYSPERLAKGIVRAVARDRAVAPLSPEAKVAYWTKRLFPGLMHWIGQQAGKQMLRQAGKL
jgi:NAD(P)-dependent dehydrogenase (short-subunit alcohol dehydrogenase family)